jgi:type I restriction enzyme S subunit
MSESAVQLNEAKPLPQGWQWVRLRDIGPIRDGDWILNADYAPSGVRLLQVADIGVGDFVDKSSRFITSDRARELNCTFLEPGDILISRLPDPIGRACQLPNLGYSCITAVDVSIWRPKLDVADRQYLTYYLNFSDWFACVNYFVSGATRPRISRSNLETLGIPLPPLSEQKRLATRIRELMQEVEHARTACEAQLEAAKALPSVYLRQVFESDAAKKWERRRLGEICEVVTGNTPSKNNPENYGDYLPWVKPEDLDKEMYVKDTGEHLSALGASQARILPRGTVMVSCIGNLGKIAIAGRELATNQQINSLIPKLEVNSEYLYFCCRTIQSTLEKLSASTTLKIVNKTAFASIAIPLPQLATQHQIAAELKERIASAEKLKASIEKQLDVIKALPQAILRKAFSGEL